MASALGQLRVLDLSEIVSGQYCSRLLADFGADVVLVEPPGGTVTRRMGPFRQADGESQLYLHLNLGKRSVELDRGTAEGWETLVKLAAAADIILVPPGVDRAALQAANPQAVIALVSDFGEDGPRAGWRGTEMIHQALSGIMFRNGRPERQPLYGCGRRAYYATGVATYVAVLSAIFVRARTGAGQQVAVDVNETASSMNYFAHAWFYNGTFESRLQDNKLPSAVIPCKDGWVSVFIYAHHWKRTWAALGRPEVAEDSRYAVVEDRMERWKEVVVLLRDAVADKKADDVVAAMQDAGAICARAAAPSDLLVSTHLAERDYWESVGNRRVLGPPFRLAATPRTLRGEAPRLGQDAPDWQSRPPVPVKPEAPKRTMPDLKGPLTGLRVLDVTTAWAGPFAGRVLAWLGAEVIHVESATRLDLWRGGGHAVDPLRYPNLDPGKRPYNRGILFNSQNANKLSLTVDIKKPGGREALVKLAATCDVVLSNFTPGTLARMGLDPEELRKLNPGIVVLEMTAFGNTGPMAHHGALGPSMEFGAGMGSFIGYGAGEPRPTAPAYLDPIGGFNGAAAILTALIHRQRTGEGQVIEMSQVEAAMPFMGEYILDALETGCDPQPDGNHVAYAAPHDAFPALGEEEWVAIAITSDAAWRRLCVIIGHEELADDPRFATMEERLKNQNALYDRIADWTRTRPKGEIAELLQSAGIPAAPAQNGRDLASDPYLVARGFFTALDHPEAGRHPNQGLPFKLSATPGGLVRAAPTLGEHNQLILRDYIHLSDAEMATLEQAGTISNIPA